MTQSSASIRVPEWVKRLDTLPDRATQQAIGKSRDLLLAEARKNASKGGQHGLRVRSGRLLRSIRVSIKPDGQSGATLSLGMVFYGWLHDRGATIVPKKGPGLRFFIPGVGWRTAMKVVLPARHWATDALDDTRKAFPKYLTQALERAVRS